MLTLSIRDKNGEERILEFDKEEVTIGRTQGSDIVLPRNNISKRHARLVDKDDKVVIVDLRSTNGTYVNGRRITAPEILTPEDKVYIGDFVLRLHTGEAEAGSTLEERPSVPTAPGPPPAPSDGPTEAVGGAAAAMQAEMEATVAVAAIEDEPPSKKTSQNASVEAPEDLSADVEQGKKVAKTVAAMPPAMDPPATKPAEAPAPAPAPAPAAPAAAAAVAVAAPSDSDVPEAWVEAVKKRVFMSIGGERGASRIVAGEKWSGLQTQVTKAIETAIGEGAVPESADKESLATASLAGIVGLGVIGELLEDESVQAIHVNAFDTVIVLKDGGYESTGRTYPSAEVLEHVVSALAREMGHEPGLVGTCFDGNLPSGAAVEVVGRPVAPRGPAVVVRKARGKAVTPDAMVEGGGLNKATLEYLSGAIAARRNIVVAGRSGSGRTTVASALAHLVPAEERVALVEKVRSIELPHANLVHLDADAVTSSGADLSELLPRLLADRVILDEVDGAEVYDLVGLALAGHDGIIAVMQGQDGGKLLKRMALQLELVAGAPLGRSADAMVAETVDVVVTVERGEGGEGRIVEVIEVEGATAEGFGTRQILARE